MADLAALVERCREGDPLAWEALVERFQGRVYGLALHYLRDPADARDLAQEVFIQVYRQLDRFQGGAFLPWLLRVARNRCIDQTRRIKARPPASDLQIGEAIDLPSDAPGPEAAHATSEAQALVHRALHGMSESNREVLVLKEIQGLGFKEIAAMLGLPVGTVKSRSHRARLELAQRIVAIDPSFGSV